MKLRLAPFARSPRTTLSELFVNDVFECFVLEPANPIPAGTYFVKLQPSARFGRLMPFLQDVPGHTGIEIHPGNSSADTRDCLLVGLGYGPDHVFESKIAFDRLFAKLEATSPITIEITRSAILPGAPPVEELKGALPMADPTPQNGKLKLTNHPAASASLVVGSATSIALAIAKARYGIDLAGQEVNVAVVLGAIAAYLTKGQVQ